MGKILLANFEEEAGARLAAFLRNERHDVSTAVDNEPLLPFTGTSDSVPDLVILDVSQNDRRVRNLLDQICSHRIKHGPRPMLLCISRAYRGAQFELDLERKGARVVYVR